MNNATDAIFDAENHGIEFVCANDGWHWCHEDDRKTPDYWNGPFQTKDEAARDWLSGADYIFI